MDLQYISDTQGRHTAVVIPIEEWNNITAKHEDLKILERVADVSTKNAARFKGILNNEEADKYTAYLNQARNEWQRDI